MTGAKGLRVLPRLLQQVSRCASAEASAWSSALQCSSYSTTPVLHRHWLQQPTAFIVPGKCQVGAAPGSWQPWAVARHHTRLAARTHVLPAAPGTEDASSSLSTSPTTPSHTPPAPATSSTGGAPNANPGLMAAGSVAITAALAAAGGGTIDAAMLGGLGQVLAFSMWSGGRNDWLRSLGAPSYLPLLTASLLAANLGVFVMQQLDPGIVYHLGEIPYKIRNGELWRLVTPVFLHSGILHLLVNSYAMYSLGSALEGMLGRARFGTIYFGSAVAGNATAALMTANSYHIGMGSSTALYGLFGAYVVDLLLTRGLRGAFATGEMNSVLITMGINAAITLSVPGLSIWGHAGGFVGGGALLYLTRGWRRWRY